MWMILASDYSRATTRFNTSAAIFPPVTNSTLLPGAGNCFIQAAAAAAPAGSASTCSCIGNKPMASSSSSSLTRTTSSTSPRTSATFAATGRVVARPSAIVSAVSVTTTRPVFPGPVICRRVFGLNADNPHRRT